MVVVVIVLLPHEEQEVAGEHSVQPVEVGVDGGREVRGRHVLQAPLLQAPLLLVLVLTQSTEQLEHLRQERRHLKYRHINTIRESIKVGKVFFE